MCCVSACFACYPDAEGHSVVRCDVAECEDACLSFEFFEFFEYGEAGGVIAACGFVCVVFSSFKSFMVGCSPMMDGACFVEFVLPAAGKEKEEVVVAHVVAFVEEVVVKRRARFYVVNELFAELVVCCSDAPFGGDEFSVVFFAECAYAEESRDGVFVKTVRVKVGYSFSC